MINDCQRDPIDNRDFQFEKTLGAGEAMTQVDWEKGFDIEKELGIKIPIKNQFGSYSCCGQAGSYLEGVANYKETKTYQEMSAKSIYSQISLGQNQGAYLRDVMKFLVNIGTNLESDVPSYKADGTTDETFMRDKAWITPTLVELAKIFQGKDYYLVNGVGIDIFARAIKDSGFGVLAGIEATNNGTMRSAYPVPPSLETPQNKLWGHALFFCKFKFENGKKYVGAVEAWGEDVGENGIQWFGEEWFANDNRWIFNPWVLIDKSNNKTMFTFKKLRGDKNIWICNEETKERCIFLDMPTMSFFTNKFEEVSNLDGYKIRGTQLLIDRVVTD